MKVSSVLHSVAYSFILAASAIPAACLDISPDIYWFVNHGTGLHVFHDAGSTSPPYKVVSLPRGQVGPFWVVKDAGNNKFTLGSSGTYATSVINGTVWEGVTGQPAVGWTFVNIGGDLFTISTDSGYWTLPSDKPGEQVQITKDLAKGNGSYWTLTSP